MASEGPRGPGGAAKGRNPGEIVEFLTKLETICDDGEMGHFMCPRNDGIELFIIGTKDEIILDLVQAICSRLSPREVVRRCVVQSDDDVLTFEMWQTVLKTISERDDFKEIEITATRTDNQLGYIVNG